MSNTKTTSYPAPRRITARQQAWNSMRIFREFTEGDIESTADISLQNLRVYLRLLTDCEYLRIIGTREEYGPRRARQIDVFSLLHDTGPRAPKEIPYKHAEEIGSVTRMRGVFDPNTGERIVADRQPTIRSAKCGAIG